MRSAAGATAHGAATVCRNRRATNSRWMTRRWKTRDAPVAARGFRETIRPTTGGRWAACGHRQTLVIHRVVCAHVSGIIPISVVTGIVEYGIERHVHVERTKQGASIRAVEHPAHAGNVAIHPEEWIPIPSARNIPNPPPLVNMEAHVLAAPPRWPWRHTRRAARSSGSAHRWRSCRTCARPAYRARSRGLLSLPRFGRRQSTSAEPS
jgi:hypothetical protein